MSTNSSISWIGTAASPFCSFVSSYLKRKAPSICVKHLIEQNNFIRSRNQVGTTICYLRPKRNQDHKMSVVIFEDASRIDKSCQIGIISGLLPGELKKGYVFHTFWISHKCKRPVKSVLAAESLAAAEAIDEGEQLSKAFSENFRVEVKLLICVDSKELFTYLSTQILSLDKSIRCDVVCIRFEFETGEVDRIIWIPGKVNIADLLKKKDSPLSEVLQLTLTTGRICVDLESTMQTKSSEKIFG